MSRAETLRSLLTARRDLRGGEVRLAEGNFPLTVPGTFGGFPLQSFSVRGATSYSGTPSPAAPVTFGYVGGYEIERNQFVLKLDLKITDGDGIAQTVRVESPSKAPLRSVGNTYDELTENGIVRRVGCERDPDVSEGDFRACGTANPTVYLSLGDGTAISDSTPVLCSHLAPQSYSDVRYGRKAGWAARNGNLLVSIPRAIYRRYVNGCDGETTRDPATNRLTDRVPAGRYLVTVGEETYGVTLSRALHGAGDYSDLVTYSKDGVKITRRTAVTVLNDDMNWFLYEPEPGLKLIALSKSTFGAVESFTQSTVCSHLDFVDAYSSTIATMTGPVIGEDLENWYFRIPGVNNLRDLSIFLTGQEAAGTPLTVCYGTEHESEEEIALSDVWDERDDNLPGLLNDGLFDDDSEGHLIPAFRAFLEEEEERGRAFTILYPLSPPDVTTESVNLPLLRAGEGNCTFTATSPEAGMPDPVRGAFSVFANEDE